jgi:hypothetical protein
LDSSRECLQEKWFTSNECLVSSFILFHDSHALFDSCQKTFIFDISCFKCYFLLSFVLFFLSLIRIFFSSLVNPSLFLLHKVIRKLLLLIVNYHCSQNGSKRKSDTEKWSQFFLPSRVTFTCIYLE